MIRQSIRCDMCGVQKREANHWFIAYEDSGELRVGGWSAQQLFRPGRIHLCGENCLHKLLSEFLAHAEQVQTLQTAASLASQQAVDSTGTSISSGPRASRHLQRQLTSTLSRSGQNVNCALEDDHSRCTGRRTS